MQHAPRWQSRVPQQSVGTEQDCCGALQVTKPQMS
jgi:hypothetical protein